MTQYARAGTALHLFHISVETGFISRFHPLFNQVQCCVERAVELTLNQVRVYSNPKP
jgi:hypothetical protein